jgi:hypothetical protein
MTMLKRWILLALGALAWRLMRRTIVRALQPRRSRTRRARRALGRISI